MKRKKNRGETVNIILDFTMAKIPTVLSNYVKKM